MFVYFKFFHEKNWHPRQVDELYDDEEYWLPNMEDAFTEAASIWSDIQDKNNNPPLAY